MYKMGPSCHSLPPLAPQQGGDPPPSQVQHLGVPTQGIACALSSLQQGCLGRLLALGLACCCLASSCPQQGASALSCAHHLPPATEGTMPPPGPQPCPGPCSRGALAACSHMALLAAACLILPTARSFSPQLCPAPAPSHRGHRSTTHPLPTALPWALQEGPRHVAALGYPGQGCRCVPTHMLAVLAVLPSRQSHRLLDLVMQ